MEGIWHIEVKKLAENKDGGQFQSVSDQQMKDDLVDDWRSFLQVASTDHDHYAEETGDQAWQSQDQHCEAHHGRVKTPPCLGLGRQRFEKRCRIIVIHAHSCLNQKLFIWVPNIDRELFAKLSKIKWAFFNLVYILHDYYRRLT